MHGNSPTKKLLSNPSILYLAAALLALPNSACSDPDVEDNHGYTCPDKPAPKGDPVGDKTIHELARHNVDGDNLVGTVKPTHLSVWKRFASFFPASTRPEVKLFVAIDAIKSCDVDGAMQPSATNPKDFYVALDVTNAFGAKALDRTMIHEFAHLLTLRSSQIPIDESAVDKCTVYTTDKGCPTEAAYLRKYCTEFWPDYLLATARQDPPDAKEKRFATGNFVTQYAASSPTEDIAEVFAEWVMRDKVGTGNTVLERKLRFFADYSEVVTIRAAARKALGK